uniref:Uncharacterized protein n=1 Tax=Mustela putorius furo TaxID=9669 RepID=M3Y1Y0_MUSPF
GPDLKADLQKLPQAKAGHVTGYHPDVKVKDSPRFKQEQAGTCKLLLCGGTSLLKFSQ